MYLKNVSAPLFAVAYKSSFFKSVSCINYTIFFCILAEKCCQVKWVGRTLINNTLFLTQRGTIAEWRGDWIQWQLKYSWVVIVYLTIHAVQTVPHCPLARPIAVAFMETAGMCSCVPRMEDILISALKEDRISGSSRPWQFIRALQADVERSREHHGHLEHGCDQYWVSECGQVIPPP